MASNPPMPRLDKVKRMWLISDSDYDKLRATRTPLLPSVDLNQLRTRFMQDRVMNQVQDDSAWNRLHDRIKPMLQAQQTTTIPPPQAPPSPARSMASPSGSVYSTASPSRSEYMTASPSRSVYLSPPSSIEDPEDLAMRSFQNQSIHEMIEADEREEKEQQEKEADMKQTEEEALKIILEETNPPKIRPKVERLFKMLISQPEVKITSNWVYIHNDKCNIRSALLLTDLVKPNKKFKYKNNPALLNVLAKLPGVGELVLNQEAKREINQRKRPGREERRRESLSNLDELSFSTPRKGSGKVKKGRKVLQWRSLFR